MRARAIRSAWLTLLMAAALCPAVEAAEPATTRDPMQAPPELRPPRDPANEGAAAAEMLQPQQLIFIDGRPLLVLGSRRYGVGERIGDARIERITEQAVWLRDATGTHRLPLFLGVDKISSEPTRGKKPASPATSKTQNRDPS